MSSPPVLAVENVRKVYRDGRESIEALSGVTLSIPSGAFWVVRGPSGSGKTTLLGVLGGLITPTSGDARIQGESVVRMRDRQRTELRRRVVGFVFQELGLVSRMSALENALLPLVPTGGPGREELARVRRNLERFGLGPRMDTSVERLSGGERQRVALARALTNEPSVLLLDEPTAHLDGARAREVLDLLLALREGGGRSIVLATHDPRLADDPRVDRVVEIADGRVQ